MDHSTPVLEAPVDATVAAGTGYNEAKWIVEKVLETASSKTALRAASIRLGQITGTSAGAWKETEWLPSMIKSSVYLGCLPTFDQVSQVHYTVIQRPSNETGTGDLVDPCRRRCEGCLRDAKHKRAIPSPRPPAPCIMVGGHGSASETAWTSSRLVSEMVRHAKEEWGRTRCRW